MTAENTYTLAARGRVFRVYPLGVLDGKERFRIVGTGPTFIASVWDDGTVTTMNERTGDSMKVKGSYVRLTVEDGRLFPIAR